MDPLVASIFQTGDVLVKLENAVSATYTIRAANAAALTLFLWDVLLNLSREIPIVWTTRLTVIKVLYLVNRYVAPLSMAVHIWTFSGLSSGLSDSRCRIIYSIASLAELLCISFVSLVIAIRLYAVYELSSRALYIFIAFWFIIFVSVSALTVPNLWLRLNSMRYVPVFNVCALNISSTFWTQLLPKVIEHGVLCIFLIYNAMSTPRSSQTAMVAMLYRGGIVYYAFTFVVLMSTMMAWRFGSTLYIGMTAFTTGLFLTMSASHLLLNMGSQKNPGWEEETDTMPLNTYPSNQEVPFVKMLRYHRSQTSTPTLTNDAFKYGTQAFDSVRSRSSSRASTLHSMHSEGTTIRVQETYVRKRAWWLLGAEYGAPAVERRVIIDRFMDLETPEYVVQGVKISRLGKFDSWL